MKHYNPGDTITLKKECMDVGDENFTFIVLEDRDDRVLVEISDSERTYNFSPQQIVFKSDIELL